LLRGGVPLEILMGEDIAFWKSNEVSTELCRVITRCSDQVVSVGSGFVRDRVQGMSVLSCEERGRGS